MSGIIGIVNLNGEPLDPSLLRRMTDYMAVRGPDAQHVWSDGSVGFGHTLLSTTWEARFEQQPLTLDGQVWIVADTRIDDRETLAEKLGIAPLPTPPFTAETKVITDVELILRAYLHWGDDCVEHLLGDFAMAIWDARHQRLFCARDRFGVKPFYYSQIGNCLLISNTIDCLRQHPQVSSELNDAAIGDFLMFDLNYNLETTVFADIQRLPAAHILTISLERGLQTQQYWTLPIPELIRYRQPQDYLDRFAELMGTAVKDRLRLDKVVSLLSGGLDSTTIAATALAVARRSDQPLDLKAFTTVYDRLFDDRERYYAGLAATKLGIPIEYHCADDYELYQDQYNLAVPMPEPANNPFRRSNWDNLQQIATHSRVALCGHGGDEALAPTTVSQMLQTMPLSDVLLDVSRTYFQHGIKPSWGSGVLALLRRPNQLDRKVYPQWLNPDFVRRCSLADRWHHIMDSAEIRPSSPRARAYANSTAIVRSQLLESHDPGCSGVPVEIRLPFIDLRLLSYLLALPPAPWCVDKMLLRTAMKQILPEAVRLRPKSPLAGDPLAAKGLQGIDRGAIEKLLPAIERYVDGDRVSDPIDSTKIWEYWGHVSPISLAYWFDRYPAVVKDLPRRLSTRLPDTS
jgi:asparagine synthase (glutamine-hydrolysing)